MVMGIRSFHSCRPDDSAIATISTVSPLFMLKRGPAYHAGSALEIEAQLTALAKEVRQDPPLRGRKRERNR